VRLCDGFFYPISYSAYGVRLGNDAALCQSNCAAPAELYVYRNPGQEIEQAVSLNGSAYMDLPVALRFRKEYVTGCSCKQAEYNPTEIEAANKRPKPTLRLRSPKAKAGKAMVKALPPPQAPAPKKLRLRRAAARAATGDQPQLDLDVTGSNEPPVRLPPAAWPPAEKPCTRPPPAPPAPPPAAVTPPAAPPRPSPTARRTAAAFSRGPGRRQRSDNRQAQDGPPPFRPLRSLRNSGFTRSCLSLATRARPINGKRC
jgi:hypothetical protein